jgi:hypothetical protein
MKTVQYRRMIEIDLLPFFVSLSLVFRLSAALGADCPRQLLG